MCRLCKDAAWGIPQEVLRFSSKCDQVIQFQVSLLLLLLCSCLLLNQQCAWHPTGTI